MATKTRKRSKKEPAAAKAPPPAEPLIDVLKLSENVEVLVEKYTNWNSEYYKQEQLVGELQDKLDDEKAKLEILATPLRALERAMAPTTLAELAKRKPYDVALKALVTPLKTSTPSYNGGKRSMKPTGVKPWPELVKVGASDAQISKNLANLKQIHAEVDGYKITYNGELCRRTGSYQARTIVKRPQMVAEVRRVWEIPEPVKGSGGGDAPARKAAAARKKKPAAAAKSAAGEKKPAKSRSRSRKKTAKPAAESPAEVASQEVNDSLTSPPTDDDVTLRAAGGNEKPPRRDVDFGEDDDAACEVCGCDGTHACAGGCYWVEHPSKDPNRWLCSKCVGKVPPQAAKPKRPSRSRSKKREAALA